MAIAPIILNISSNPIEFVNQLDFDFLERAKKIQNSLNEPAIKLNFRENFVSNSSLVISRAFVDYLNFHGVYCQALNHGESFGYASRMGFFSDFSGGEYQLRRHPANGRFMEIELITSHDTTVSARVRRSLEEFAQRDEVYISDEALEILTYSVGELISNVRRHARFTGRVSFQYYKGSGFVEITVCDCGIGITESLANAGYQGSDVELLKLSVMKNVTSSRIMASYGERSPGVGLYHISRLVQHNRNASVIIATKRYMMKISSEYPLENPEIKYLNGYFPGSIVVVRVPNLIHASLWQVLSETLSTPFFS